MNLPENNLDDKNLFQHRNCYQHFTMKDSLEKIEQQTEQQTEALKTRLNVIDTFEDDFDVPKRSSHSQQGSGSNNQAILPKEFILCKRNKHVKRRPEGLIKCAEMRAIKLIIIFFCSGVRCNCSNRSKINCSQILELKLFHCQKCVKDCTCIRNGFRCIDECKCKFRDHMINVEDGYDGSDDEVGFSDDGDDDEQE